MKKIIIAATLVLLTTGAYAQQWLTPETERQAREILAKMTDEITLMPMDAARLRISSFPTSDK